MEGSSAKTMDGTTRITSTVGPFSHTDTGPRYARASQSERTETLRARLIQATVEVVAEGSVHRLGQSGHLRRPPMNTALGAPFPRSSH